MKFDDIENYIIEYVEKTTNAHHSRRNNVSMLLDVNIDFETSVGFDKQIYNWCEKLSKEIKEYNSNYFMVNYIKMIDSPITENFKRLQVGVLFDDNRTERVKSMERELNLISNKLRKLLENDDYDFNVKTIGKIKKKDMYDLLIELNDMVGIYRYI